MKNLKNLNATTMIAVSLLLSTGVSSLNIDNFGQIVNVSQAATPGVAITPYSIKVTTRLNVRSGPGTNYKVIKTLQGGEVFTVDRNSVNGNTTWLRIKDTNQWIAKQYTTSYSGGSTSSSLGVSIAARTVEITKRVNFRNGPGTSYDVLGQYNAGTKITIDKQSVNTKDGYTWYKVKGSNRWVASNYTKTPSTSQNTAKASTSTGSNNTTKAVKSNITMRVRPKFRITQAYTDLDNFNKMTKFDLYTTNIYNVVEKGVKNGITFYRVKALSSDKSAWISASALTQVTNADVFKVGNTHRIASGTYLYTTSGLNKKCSHYYYAALNQKAKINHLSSNKTSVNVSVWDGVSGKYYQGWINKGHLKTGALQSVHATDLENVNINDMFEDVYVLDKETQALSSQSSAENTDYMKITGTSSKPYLVQFDAASDESDPFYVEQYMVDITTRDNEVKTLRFDPSNFNLMKTLHSGQEVTLYVDPTTTDEEGNIPMMIVDADFIDLNSDTVSYSDSEPLTDVEIVNAMAEDFKEFLNSYGITVEEFSQEDIEKIVKKINNPKKETTKVTIDVNNDTVDDNESIKSSSKKSSVNSFGGMKSKF